jgi:hypothetical protein
MASSSKKKTTFSKLNREQKVRERQERKNQRRAVRKADAAETDSAPPSVLAPLPPPEDLVRDVY